MATIADEPNFVQANKGQTLDAIVVFNLLRTHSFLSSFVDAELRHQKLSATQFNALLILNEAGADGLLMSALGEQLVVSKANVTGLVDRLERNGWATRCAHRDRRVTVIRLTAEGQNLLDETMPRHCESLADLTAGLSREEKERLVQLLTKFRRELRLRRKESR